MKPLEQWPGLIVEALGRLHGTPLSATRLGGMSLARVYRAHCETGTAIVKVSPKRAEYLFYERVAHSLRAAGVPIPLLEASHVANGEYWLVLEDTPPPEDEWARGERLPIAEVTGILARLHRTTRDSPPPFLDTGVLQWNREHTRAALSCLPEQDRGPLEPELHSLEAEAASLEQRWCWISGDPSSPNWGLRPDGSLVHFDWELFRPGVPAGDLAPVVAGLGDRNGFERVVAAYIAVWNTEGSTLPWDRDTLVRQTIVAKAATVVHMLAEHVNGGARVPLKTVAYLSSTFPGWIREIART